MSERAWTKEVPTGTGTWHWWRKTVDSKPIVRFIDGRGLMYDERLEGWAYPVHFGGEWCGPINPPEDKTVEAAPATEYDVV